MIKKGARVWIHYTLTFDDEVKDTSRGSEPLEYVHGRGMLVDGLEEQLSGMKKGQKKSVVVSPEKGYGVVDANAFRKISRSSLPRGLENVEKDQELSVNIAGDQIDGRVCEISDRELTLDANHPLAGKTLHFDVEIVDVR
jgi:FKBP-type peptidyl-prolyl cis-trans isomerase 2